MPAAVSAASMIEPCNTLIYSAASEDGHLDSEHNPSPSVNSTPAAERCSSVIGLASRSTETLLVTASFPCQDLSVAGKRAGLAGSRSSLMFALIGLLSKTSITPGASGCPSCGASSTASGLPACHFECEPMKLAPSTREPASSLLPTPTASAYGSCRGGGAGRVGKWRHSLLSLGIRHPEDWERMMNFPIGHTADMPSETPSSSMPSGSSPRRSRATRS